MKVLSWRIAAETKFRNIYNLYKNDLFRLAISYTKNVSDAEDVIQEVFIKLYKNITDLHNDEHIKYWLIVTTINTCKNLNKSYWKRNIRSINEIDVSKELNNNEILDELFKLPNKYRIVIFLYYYEGYKTKEIASILNTKESTIISILNRGRNKLKDLLER